MNVDDMLKTHPLKVTRHLDAIVACVKACYACSEACTLCADACLGEKQIDPLRRCIRMDLDCAAVCAATGPLVARQTETDTSLLRKQLEACAVACRVCGDECEKHAGHHEHCRLCAQSCRACETACNDLLASL